MAKVRQASYIFQKAKIRYGQGLIFFKCKNKVQLGSYIVENAKIRYG